MTTRSPNYAQSTDLAGKGAKMKSKFSELCSLIEGRQQKIEHTRQLLQNVTFKSNEVHIFMFCQPAKNIISFFFHFY